jgi:hypothetical protein
MALSRVTVGLTSYYPDAENRAIASDRISLWLTWLRAGDPAFALSGEDRDPDKSTICEQNMTEITGAQSPPKLHRGDLKPLRWGVAITWISWLLSVGLLLVEHWLWVLHPWSVLFLIALVVTLSATVTTLVLGFWRVLRGGRRRAALGWSLCSLFPVLVWVSLGLYAHRNGQKGYHPHNLPMTLMTRVGHNLMEAQAVYLYPHRLETERLVMFYGDSVIDPGGDIQAMDRHVAHLEEMTGLPLRAKIYWARGSLLGRGGGLCVFGIVMGSDESPADHLDQHELAHAVEAQHGWADKDLPTLLAEGWAESQSVDAVTLAADALQYRQTCAEMAKNWGKLSESERGKILSNMVEPQGQERLLRKVWQGGPAVYYLRELTDSFWYRRHNGPVYTVGGAFVDFLVRHYGAKRFVEFYFASRPGTFEGDCHRFYGLDLENLEKAFWSDAEQLAGIPLSPKGATTTAAEQGKAGDEENVGQVPKEAVGTAKSDQLGVTLEFRLAEAEPVQGLTEAAVPGTADTVYLHKERGITNKDIAGAHAVVDQWMKPAVFIRLTEDGRKKMAELTENKGKRLAILVDGKVISAPLLLSKISSGEGQFGVATQAEAERIAKGINKR